MILRSLGAGRFSGFWQYWNPIWGFYLGKFIFKPLKKIFPSALSLILTFIFSGFIHDAVIMLLHWNFELLLTPWFFLMSLFVIIGDFTKIDYSKFPWIFRAAINIAIIAGCLYIAYQVRV